MANKQRFGKDATIIWNVIKNEDKEGANPYTLGYKQIEKLNIERKRNLSKEREISPKPFTSLVRESKANDDKLKINSLN